MPFWMEIFLCLSEGAGSAAIKSVTIWSDGVDEHFLKISDIQKCPNYPWGGGTNFFFS